jgi:hypothetical protein
VIVHERLGEWIRQLRPRVSDRPVRWFETRSAADLEGVLTGLAFPVIVIDLRGRAASGLEDLDRAASRAPDARILVLDPEAHPGVAELARELGATHVVSGFLPPPEVADLLGRWIALALRGLEQAGWSRPTFPETETDPWGWLADCLGQPESRPPKPGVAPPRPPRLPATNRPSQAS